MVTYHPSSQRLGYDYTTLSESEICTTAGRCAGALSITRHVLIWLHLVGGGSCLQPAFPVCCCDYIPPTQPLIIEIDVDVRSHADQFSCTSCSSCPSWGVYSQKLSIPHITSQVSLELKTSGILILYILTCWKILHGISKRVFMMYYC